MCVHSHLCVPMHAHVHSHAMSYMRKARTAGRSWFSTSFYYVISRKNSCCQTRQQGPLTAELTHWPRGVLPNEHIIIPCCNLWKVDCPGKLLNVYLSGGWLLVLLLFSFHQLLCAFSIALSIDTQRSMNSAAIPRLQTYAQVFALEWLQPFQSVWSSIFVLC